MSSEVVLSLGRKRMKLGAVRVTQKLLKSQLSIEASTACCFECLLCRADDRVIRLGLADQNSVSSLNIHLESIVIADVDHALDHNLSKRYLVDEFAE